MSSPDILRGTHSIRKRNTLSTDKEYYPVEKSYAIAAVNLKFARKKINPASFIRMRGLSPPMTFIYYI
jgi:hypothetical protein